MKKENSSHYKRSKKLKALRFGQYTLNAIGIIVKKGRYGGTYAHKCNRYHRSMLRSL